MFSFKNLEGLLSHEDPHRAVKADPNCMETHPRTIEAYLCAMETYPWSSVVEPEPEPHGAETFGRSQSWNVEVSAPAPGQL
jgi:hypothetical protein